MTTYKILSIGLVMNFFLLPTLLEIRQIYESKMYSATINIYCTVCVVDLNENKNCSNLCYK